MEDSLTYVTKRLRSKKHTYSHIASQTGCSVRWLQMIASGEIKDPGWSRIKRLEIFFTGQAK